MIDFDRLCLDRRIDTAPPGHKHHRRGWINVSCPVGVHGPGYHLGYNEEHDYFCCWGCGHQRHVAILALLLRCSHSDALRTLESYQMPGRKRRGRTGAEKQLQEFAGLPMGCGPITGRHCRYLEGRGFDPRALAETWGLQGTGRIGPYKFRVIAPITHMGRVVSYQGRDITGRSKLKYKACPARDESRPHQTCLYGLDLVEGQRSVVVVEGIADAWRLGPGAVATFGIAWTQAQAILLAPFERVFVLFDFGEREARRQALRLANAVQALGGGDVEIVDGLGDGDPGDLPPAEAARVMRELL